MGEDSIHHSQCQNKDWTKYGYISMRCWKLLIRGWTLQGADTMMTSSNGNIFRVTGPLCGEFTGPGEFPTQRPVTRSFDVFFDLRLNKRLSKQPWSWWFETPSWSLWRHCNVQVRLILLPHSTRNFTNCHCCVVLVSSHTSSIPWRHICDRHLYI